MSDFQFNKESYSKFDDFLKLNNSYDLGIYGLSQNSAGYIYNTSRTNENLDEYNRLKECIMTKYNVNEDLFVKIIKGLNSDGACTYGVLVGIIFDQFKNNQEEFESKFGFPMFVNLESGRALNQAQLITDLYIFSNHNINGGKLFTYNEKSETIISDNSLITTDSGIDTFDASKQIYLFGFNGSSYFDGPKANLIINNYLDSYNVENLEQHIIATNVNEIKKNDACNNEFELGLNKIGEALDNNESILLMLSYDMVRYISKNDYGDGYIEYETEVKRDGAHIVNVIGIEHNSLVVTTNGRISLVPVEDILNSRFVISGTVIDMEKKLIKG